MDCIAHSQRGREVLLRTVVLSTLVMHCILLLVASLKDAPTWDEGRHYVAGIHYWRTGSCELYSVNPPLVRTFATALVAFATPLPCWQAPPEAEPDRWIAQAYFRTRGRDAFKYLMIARITCSAFSIAGAYVCYRWARELYGAGAGYAALVLWCTCPNVIAHGHLITPDVAAAALGVGSCYAFWCWMKAPGSLTCFAAGVLLGLAQLTKFSLIVMCPLFVGLFAICGGSTRRNVHSLIQLAAIFGIALFVINLGFCFEGSCTPLGDYSFVSKSLTVERDGIIANRFMDHWLGRIPVPLPAQYISGIDGLKHAVEHPSWSFLHGQRRLGAWWYYYVYACVIKVPVGTILLLLCAISVTVTDLWKRYARSKTKRCASTSVDQSPWSYAQDCSKQCSESWRDEMMLVVPAIALFTFVSSQTAFSRHLRYVLPAFPLLFIWMSKVFVPRVGANVLHYVAVALLSSTVVSSVWSYPHSISYFNESIGGPLNGHLYLGASNTEWGQDLLYLKRWYDSHPYARPLHVACDPPWLDPRSIGIDSEPVPSGPATNGAAKAHDASAPWSKKHREATPSLGSEDVNSVERGPQPGWFAIGVNRIHSVTGEYAYFLELQPIDWAGYSIQIHYISIDQVNKLRRKLGLPEIPRHHETADP